MLVAQLCALFIAVTDDNESNVISIVIIGSKKSIIIYC